MLKAKFSLPKRNLCASFNMPDCSMSASFEMSNGTKNYEKLENKPSINGVELIGNKTSSELGLATAEQGALAESALQEVPSYYVTEAELASELSTKQNVINDLSEIREGAGLGSTSVQPNDISDMATQTWVENKGYTTNKGTVTSVNGNQPDANGNVEITIPTDTSDLTNGAGFIRGIDSSDVITALGFTPYNSSNPSGYTSNVGTVTSVNGVSPDSNGNVEIQTGEDITVDSELSTTSENPVQNKVITGALNGKQDTLIAGTDLEIVQDSILPSGYTQLNSITTTGSQYINTGLWLTDNFKAEIVGKFTSTTGTQCMLGATMRTSNATYRNIVLCKNASQYYVGNGSPWYRPNQTNSSATLDTNEHTFVVEITSETTKISIDGVENTASYTSSSVEENLYLFANNAVVSGGTSSAADFAQFEAKSVKLYDNGNLIFNGVPCKRGDIAGLYDTVSATFMSSLGSSAFVAGEETPLQDIINFTNKSGYITGIDSNDVTNALGYVPYNSSNPDGYTSNVGTVTSVNGTQPDASGNVTITTVASYNDLTNKPSINGFTLSGDKTSANLNLQEKLVSGVNIKKINNISLLGSGNIDIQGGGGGTDKSAVVVSGLNTVPPAFNLDITSEYEFSFDTLKYLHVLTKSKTGNAFGVIDVQFWKDSRNYMRFGCYGAYEVSFKLVINNQTIVNQTLGSTHDMDNYTDILTEMDMVIKKVKVYGAKQGTNATLLYSFDFSSYDYSALDTFYIKSSLCRWGGGNIYNQSIYVNNKTDYTSMINFHYRYGEYNAIPQLVYPEEFGMATSVKGGDTSGSTVIQTYSPTHKLIDVNMGSEAYFAMGTYSSTYTAKTAMMYTKFRVTEITTSCRLTRGAGSAGNYFFDYDTGEFIVKDNLTPELNKWYLLVEDVTNGVSYTSTYGVRAVGQFKLENEGMFVSSVQSQNINAETCRGLYFTGPIPFNTENTKWETPSFASNEAGRVVPIGALYIPANGNISMYNGTAWKAISS